MGFNISAGNIRSRDCVEVPGIPPWEGFPWVPQALIRIGKGPKQLFDETQQGNNQWIPFMTSLLNQSLSLKEENKDKKNHSLEIRKNHFLHPSIDDFGFC